LNGLAEGVVVALLPGADHLFDRQPGQQRIPAASAMAEPRAIRP
jgi:hypothetical protein